jgi:hypothetical protein
MAGSSSKEKFLDGPVLVDFLQVVVVNVRHQFVWCEEFSSFFLFKSVPLLNKRRNQESLCHISMESDEEGDGEKGDHRNVKNAPNVGLA